MFLIIVGFGGLFAYDPEFVMELFGQGAQTPSAPIITAVPKAKRAPVVPAVPTPPISMPNVISTSPALPSQPMPMAAAAVSGNVGTSPVPLYSEGQRVLLLADPAVPTETVNLSPESSGKTQGPALHAGTFLTILDGELRETGWVYSVRSAEGLTGWLPEKRLALAR
jgi:hypothetical protein